MEFNKEEATRAKENADMKMQIKDFAGAKKLALTAQALNPELENILQIITVCEVHCSSETNILGNEKDWYDILKVEHAADEASIKKQYRKLALLLHPDKNKFSGASDAFKLIGDAQRVLLDADKRRVYDAKRRSLRASLLNRTPQQPFSRFNFQNPQSQSQHHAQTAKATFWTSCPFCGVRYEFYRDVMNRRLICQQCKAQFTACEVKRQPAPFRCDPPQPSVHRTSNVNPGSANFNVPKPTVHRTSNVNPGSGNLKVPQPSSVHANPGGVNSKAEFGKSSGSQNETAKSRKRAKSPNRAESVNETKEAGDLKDSNNLSKQSFDEQSLRRRSTRSKQNVSYDENKSENDNDETIPSKKMKSSSPSEEEIPQKKETDDSTSDEKDAPQVYPCPDPDFSDFDSNRKEESFKPGQLWACYDDIEAMPRFYARIVKVLSPGFKLKIMWLEAEPNEDDEDQHKWVDAGLPVSCGIFKRCQYETTEDLCMFSHLVPKETASKAKKGDAYKIYPRKGETWALFKNWDVNWHSDPSFEKKFEYEFVEVLSDYDENGSGVLVAPLEKVKGFVCVFCRRTAAAESSSVWLLPKELYRFSHMVPSFQMSGKEREGVPKGSFELDPASLSPGCVEEVKVS